MKNISVNSLSVSVRIYRALLVAYPKAFREHYETQLVQVFRDSTREAYHLRGMSGVIDLWLHTFADLVVTALMERTMERSQYMFSPKVILWGGLASVFGGFCWIFAGFSTNSNSLAALVLALVLGLGGLVGLYSRQAGQGGGLGLAGFVWGMLGTGVGIAALWWGSVQFDPPIPILLLAMSLAILGVGIVLLGLNSWRGNVLHRWRGFPLGLGLLNILVGITFLLMFYLPLNQGLNPWKQWYLIGGHVIYPADLMPQVLSVLLGVGWMGLGILLAIEANAEVAQPPETLAETR
jgi:hypothetical protein